MPIKGLFRLTAIIVALSLSIVGCSNSSNKSSNSPANSNAAEPSQATSTSSSSTDETVSTSSPSSSTDEKVTIRISMGASEITKEQIDEFNREHPNINLVLAGATFEKLMGMIAANSNITPDIFRVNGANDFPFYASRGLALNLQKYFDASPFFKKEDLGDIANIFRWDGEKTGQGDLYGFVKDWSPDFNIFINKKLFAEAGIPIPSDKEPLTWDQVMDFAKKLTKKQGDQVTQWGIMDPFAGGAVLSLDIMLAQLATQNQTLYSADNDKIVLDTPEAKAIIQYWVDAAKSPVGPSALHSESQSFVDLFTQGKLGMLICGYWFSGILRSTEASKSHLDDFMLLPAPIVAGGKRVEATRSGTGAIIYSKTKHPDEAWTVFEWFYGGKPADDRAKSGGGLPAFKSKMALIPTTTAFDKQTADVVNEDLKYLTVLGYNPYMSATAAKTILDKYMTPVYFDKDTVDGAIEKITNEINIQIRENKDIVGVE